DVLVSWTIPTASDNCNVASFVLDLDGGSNVALIGNTQLAEFAVGVYNVTYTATDGSGNMATCTFVITVIDDEDPIITGCPSNITVGNDPGECGADVPWSPPTASDNCPGVTLTTTHAPGSFFPKGTTTVLYTATDAYGNTATCSFTVTVNDTELPTITCP